MGTKYDFTRLRRTIIINRTVQIFFLVLLAISALKFQAGLTAEGRPQRFLHSAVVAVVLQLALFYPLSRFGSSDARREADASAAGLSGEEQQGLRRKRIFSDTIKGAIFLFFVSFISIAPGDVFFQSIIFYTFILTTVSYLQSYNFAAKRAMQEKS